MRILIVDDEKIVLDAVTHILGQAFEDLEIETARSGKEGLLVMSRFRPNLLMTDIRMPGMSGLELIREARRIDDQVHIVIATAFDQFDYAKEAFKYQVDDFVLKPLTKQKLIEVVTKVRDRVLVEEKRYSTEVDSMDRMYRSMQMIENHFFYAAFSAPAQYSEDQLDNFRELLSLPLKKGILVAVEAVALPTDASWQQVGDYNNRLYEACSDFSSQLKRFYSGMCSQVMGQRFYSFIDLSDDGTFGGLEGEAAYFELAHNRALKQYAIKWRIAYVHLSTMADLIWGHGLLMAAFRTSSRNVIQADHDGQGGHGSQGGQGGGEPGGSLDGLFESFDNLYDAIGLLAEPSQWEEDYQKMVSEYVKLLENPSMASLAQQSLEVFFVRMGLMWEQRVGRSGDLVREGWFGTFSAALGEGKLTGLRALLLQLSGDSAAGAGTGTGTGTGSGMVPGSGPAFGRRQSEISQPVAYGLQQIQGHYHEELTLEDVAKGAHVSAPYLSKIFKDETGTTFKAYLTRVRIDAAKNLLLAGDQSVKDVAYAIGYNDPNYFVRLFKKETGFTPGEYVKVMS